MCFYEQCFSCYLVNRLCFCAINAGYKPLVGYLLPSCLIACLFRTASRSWLEKLHMRHSPLFFFGNVKLLTSVIGGEYQIRSRIRSV